MILTTILLTLLFYYYLDLLINLGVCPQDFKNKQHFLKQLIPFKKWIDKFKPMKNYNNLPSAKEK